jgi:hypothetical protein
MKMCLNPIESFFSPTFVLLQYFAHVHRINIKIKTGN